MLTSLRVLVAAAATLAALGPAGPAHARGSLECFAEVPGVTPRGVPTTFTYDDGEKEYDAWDGTSMATPHVAGAAALVLAKWPALSPAQVIKKLTTSADRVAGAKKGSASYGAGRLNCQKALR